MNRQPYRQQFWKDLSRFPWRNTAAVLGERFRADQLGLRAGSLTFTTTIALVPLFAVALALFTAFPSFARMQRRLQNWLISSLIPEDISHQVLGYVTSFAGKAGGLGLVGMVALLFTAIALILNIDYALNKIWRVREPRPLGQRVLIYWAAITLGPLLLAVSLSTTAAVFAASRDFVGSGVVRLFFSGVRLLLMTVGATALYHYVPNTEVKWSHAWAGGIFTAIAMEIAKRMLGWYLSLAPTYSILYGAFAAVPILLIWIYTAWVIVLLGAVIAAYMPSLLAGVQRRGGMPGWHFQLAVEVLQHLAAVRDTPERGLDAQVLAARLRVDDLQLEPVFESLVALDWIGHIDESPAEGSARYVLLVPPQNTALAPLLHALLLPQDATLQAVWAARPLAQLQLKDVLDAPHITRSPRESVEPVR
ncbi:MAG: YihY family inner membrane protein [Burkholderiaceae bacterium]|jgi:membrane protein|nr:YihY family inner membrane protein [Burkholderiaceae bacterium]